jgi:hypothetical protein
MMRKSRSLAVKNGKRAAKVASIAILLACAFLFSGKPAVAASTGGIRPGGGYWLGSPDGGVFSFGVSFYGSATGDRAVCHLTTPNGSCWSMAAAPVGSGYWILNADTGTIHAYGSLPSYGQPADTPTYEASPEFRPRAVQIVATRDGKGYWVLELGLSGLGTVQAFGDAGFFGDETTISHSLGHQGSPVALIGSADDQGYWIVDNDGGVFSFGGARFFGSMADRHLTGPVLTAAATNDGQGYWLASSDGGVFAFGDAAFSGSLASVPLGGPVISMAADRSGTGYWLAATDGGVFAFGGAPFLGSMSARPLDRPISTIVSAAPTT